MKKLISLFTFFGCLSLWAQSPKAALDFYGNGVLPHLAYGEYWKSILVITNKSKTKSGSISFDFYDTKTGNPAIISFASVSNPSETYSTNEGGNLGVRVPPLASIRLETTDTFETSPQVKTAWARYWSPDSEIDVYVIFRQIVPDRPVFEAVTFTDNVNGFLGSIETEFLVPFNNLPGFGTALVLCNTTDNTINLEIKAYNSSGALLGTFTESLEARRQIAFQTESRWPLTNGQLGSLHVISSEAGITSLSLLFNSTFSFTSAPTLVVKN